ncbi:MAG TPA: flavodoxin family protein [Bacillota bacterium]|nr:flavodoxin family protein [Bacillota bacterium]
MVKLLIISGTPKKEGLCVSLIQAAKAAGGDSCDLVSLTDLKLEGCRVCNEGWGQCRESHTCIINDDFNELKASFANYDGFIFITPVYWGEVSEPMKLFLDRLRRCEASHREESLFKDKKCLLVASAGGSGNGTLTCLEQLQRAVTHMGGKVFDYFSVNRWNADYKREALAKAVECMLKSN